MYEDVYVLGNEMMSNIGDQKMTTIIIIIVWSLIIIWRLLLIQTVGQHNCWCLREVFKNPSNGNFPLRGYPPPLSGLQLAEKLAEIS